VIDKNIFEKMMEKAVGRRYTSMNYIGFEDCENAKILRNDDQDQLILLWDDSKTPAMLYFATDDFGLVMTEITNIQGSLRLHFVPREFAEQLTALGFIEWAEMVDFWNYDIAKTVKELDDLDKLDTQDTPEFLIANEAEQVAVVSKKCELQSRGFEGLDLEKVLEWLDEGDVIIQRKDGTIAGFCAVSIYDKGTTLWLRAIAVDPDHQGCGIGKALVRQAIRYGSQKGATKAFLAADALNINAIGLYNKYGFFAKESEKELQMVKTGG